MSKRALRKYILPLASLLLLFYILWSIALPHVLKTQVENMLAQYGFKDANIQNVALYRDMAVFNNITLDPENSNSIETVTAYYNFSDLFSDTGFEKIAIDNLVLYGDATDIQNINVAGWSGFQSQRDFSQNQYAGIIELYSARLDLLTQAGGLRLEAKGSVNVAEDGDKTMQLNLWGKQHQLQLNSIWTGKVTKNGALTFDIDIRDLRVRLEEFNAARINGWATIEKGPVTGSQLSSVINTIAGQLTIGGMNINGVGLNEATLTFDKTDQNLTIFADAAVAGYDNISVAAELNRNTEAAYFSGTYTASTVKNFMEVSDLLHDSLQSTSYIAEPYKKDPMGLLAMEQTREDVRDIIEKNEYDMIEFSIAGPPDMLGGKITARYRDKEKSGRHVIRLLPPPAEDKEAP